MKDKVILITGATSGIGKQTAISLAEMGANVIITGRDKANAETAIQEIREKSKNPNIHYLLADISTISGVKALANAFLEKYAKLDVLINNAGSAVAEYKTTVDGFEMNFAVNVIAPYLLTSLLLDALKRSIAPKVITLMGGDVSNKIDLENLQSEKGFSGLTTYSHTKIIMMCLMYEYAQQLKNVNITCNICYPGQASTKMTQNVTAQMFPWYVRLFFPLFKLLTRPDNDVSAKKASRSSVFLASAKEVEKQTGIYVNTHSQRKEMPSVALLPENRKYLWEYVNNLLAGKAPVPTNIKP